MGGKFSVFAKRFFLFLNILAAVVYLLSAFAPYFHPQRWWFISMMGFGFPIIFLVQLGFVFIWLIFKPRYALISFLALLVSWKSISVFFAFHPGADFTSAKSKNCLRVVHWNVARFIEWSRNNNKGSRIRLEMMRQLKQQEADVLCLSEFFHSTDSIYYDNLNYVMKNMGFPYYHYSWDEDGGKQWVGQIIFSKYPIIDSATIHYPRPTMTEALISADIKFHNDTIRFYTTHLQSVRFRKRDYESIEKIKNREDSILQNSKNIFSKLKRGLIYRSFQADMLRKEIEASPHPYILTGDFNDVPNSYTYFAVSDGLQDAFLRKGFGIGRTYAYISPTLRIDYILATKDFEVLQCRRFAKMLSDHYMLVADVRLKSE